LIKAICLRTLSPIPKNAPACWKSPLCDL
jgi:hypothetical protein